MAKGDRSFVLYGKDLDGDAIPDLLIRGKPGLLLYPGRRSKSGKNLVAERPRTLKVFGNKKQKDAQKGMFYTSYRGSRPRAVDLDGDGAYEILVIERGAQGVPARVHLLRVAS